MGVRRHMPLGTGLAILLLTAATACSQSAAKSAGGTADAATAVDASLADADAGPDGPDAVDAGPDAAPPADAAPDVAADLASLDMASDAAADSAPDVEAADAADDAGPQDVAADDAVPGEDAAATDTAPDAADSADLPPVAECSPASAAIDCANKGAAAICQVWSCLVGVCTQTAIDDGAACADGSACTVGDACQAGACLPGDVTTCEDNNPCTTDACDPAQGCKHPTNTLPCSDGNACTSGDHCLDGACLPGALTTCDDANVCTNDSCDGATGNCSHENNALPCDDSKSCTSGDTCVGGLCAGAKADGSCNDANPCTDDACNPTGDGADPATGCVHSANNANACSDGISCTGDACLDGKCISIKVNASCSDGLQCTDDSCDPSRADANATTGCVHNNNDANACSDGEACTEQDHCVAGVCTAKPYTCPAPDQCHDAGACLGDGTCSNPAKANGTACNDGDACTAGETCQSGACGNPAKTTTCKAPEPCDMGDGECNPATGQCVYIAAPKSVLCRESAGPCDVVELCDGISHGCPPDAFAQAQTECRASAGVCDLPESCTGSSAACPSDAKADSSTVCRGSGGVCDPTEFCDGSADACPADVLLAATVSCRPSAGACDPQENCTGSAATCPDDAKAAAGVVCRASGGVCDVAESCDGVSNLCPVDALLAATVPCRDATGICDAVENCSGVTATCPDDVKKPADTVCRASAGVCDVAENCNGTGDDCPVDSFVSSLASCRGAAGACDMTEHCTGSSAGCPADALAPVGTQCRAAVSGGCDVAEVCSGVSVECPTDLIAPIGTVCRASLSECDPKEVCTGAANTCPADLHKAASTACGISGGPCDKQDTCDGGGLCTDNGFAPASQLCAGPDACTNATFCTGTSAICTPNFVPIGAYCGIDPEPCGGWCNIYGCDGGGNCSFVVSGYASCPMLYSWTGKEFGFESDMYTGGTLGLKVANKYRKPDPNDAYVLRQPLVEKDGLLDLRIVEELNEIDYLDEARLFAVDVPPDHRVVAWANNVPGTAIALDKRLVSIGQIGQPLLSAVRLGSGEDIKAQLEASDGSTVMLSEDNNACAWNTIEVDLGDQSSASIIKLVVDGRSRFPTTPQGFQNRTLADPQGWQTKLEVLDASGAWVQVPRSLVTLVRPKEFPRAMAIDITGIFLTKDYRLRLSWVNKTYLDAIWIDTTPNVALGISEAPLLSATLGHHGLSSFYGGDQPLYTYAKPGPKEQGLAPGSYTTYGDISALLGLADDMFAIFGTGDEVAMTFQPPAPPPAGTQRFYAFASVGYYKQWNLVDGGAVPFTVAPLPFSTMTNFPYDATQQYPTDAAHQEYLATWNTRTVP